MQEGELDGLWSSTKTREFEAHLVLLATDCYQTWRHGVRSLHQACWLLHCSFSRVPADLTTAAASQQAATGVASVSRPAHHRRHIFLSDSSLSLSLSQFPACSSFLSVSHNF
jgi:hypothetical protein